MKQLTAINRGAQKYIKTPVKEIKINLIEGKKAAVNRKWNLNFDVKVFFHKNPSSGGSETVEHTPEVLRFSGSSSGPLVQDTCPH